MTVAAFIAALPQPQRNISKALRKLIRQTAPDLEESIKWNMPYYRAFGGVCCIYPCSDHVNLQIMQGAHLKDPTKILEGTGKGMRHVKIYDARQIPGAAIKGLLKQAVARDAARRSGNTSSKRRRG